METFFHISEVYNRKSILKNGIFPSKIKLDHHLDRFREDGLLNENENKISYFWQDSFHNKKFFIDMVFCKVWIHPRNDLFWEDNLNDCFDYSKCTNKLLYKYNKMIFDIYKVNKIKEHILNYRPLHEQICSDDKYSSLYKMPDKFCHDNKILAFSKSVEKDFKIIGQIKFEFTKNKKYSIKVEY
jgi:hypothetical protein